MLDTFNRDQYRHELVELLLERSVAKGPVTLASGRTSQFFVDCKQTVLTARGHVLAGRLMLHELQSLGTNLRAVAGVELGGCPLASAVSFASCIEPPLLNALYVRKEAKDHGTQRLVEGAGDLRSGDAVAVVEDVVTTGGSTLAAVDKLTSTGLSVVAVVALVDRAEGGADAIAAAGIAFRAILRRRDLERGGRS